MKIFEKELKLIVNKKLCTAKNIVHLADSANFEGSRNKET